MLKVEGVPFRVERARGKGPCIIRTADGETVSVPLMPRGMITLKELRQLVASARRERPDAALAGVLVKKGSKLHGAVVYPEREG